jgi:hypothetical protein
MGMGRIRQCVKDVRHIANESEDLEQASSSFSWKRGVVSISP